MGGVGKMVGGSGGPSWTADRTSPEEPLPKSAVSNAASLIKCCWLACRCTRRADRPLPGKPSVVDERKVVLQNEGYLHGPKVQE